MQQDEYEDVYKIILVGDASVGKTNLIHCYAKGKIASNTMPTIGVEYNSKIVPLQQGKRAKVQIWDTAGQQQYRSITMGHYRKVKGALIVYDITNAHSFSSLEYWVNVIRERADENVQIGIIGNKTDLSSRRVVAKEQAKSMADKLNAFYLETSVKDPMSIDRAFQQLVQNVYKSFKDRHEYQEGVNNLNQNNESSSNGCNC